MARADIQSALNHYPVQEEVPRLPSVRFAGTHKTFTSDHYTAKPTLKFSSHEYSHENPSLDIAFLYAT